ncbi:AAA family ATPase [Thermosediminibacter oceani]|uniref:Cobyrinic acid a,c-diamide synthase n=1 Tax=Thermosediminibacter oceani (strain ATCC BAA-1034 / DSM 16646 / JW/IW-1228P) TaxID=555079 RepID=D9S2D7_THEOJ|nr:carbon monoxide dehydrogenase accessory protein CooC [Thermosediminibacter oceani]ADL07564.1 cobyrinic acid a,c-diamide synthase [Thermosediminibacter oceani DSM 16646]
MKIAVTGKGGVGKTTLAGVLAKIYAAEGYRVMAVDADPDANLAAALGFPEDKLNKILPLSEMRDLIAERTGAQPGLMGQMFTLNPKVEDIPERFCAEHEGVRLLVMGGIKKGGSGCACPEHTFLRAIMRHLLLESKDVLIVDMEAGIEHLGRATADAVDAFIVVVEPGLRSINTYHSIKKLAADIGIPRVLVVGNKIGNIDDEKFIKSSVGEEKLLGMIKYDPRIAEADRNGLSPYYTSEEVRQAVAAIKDEIDKLVCAG